MNEPISVTALNQYVKGLLDRDRLLGQVYVCGEVSNYKRYPSGHHYFSLKDAESSIRCVMFRGSAVRLRFRPEHRNFPAFHSHPDKLRIHANRCRLDCPRNPRLSCTPVRRRRR